MRLTIGLTINAAALLASLAGCATVADYPYMKEGQPRAEAIVAAVARDWSPEELIKSADPRLLEAFPEPKIKELVATWSRTLGAPKSQQTLVGSTGVGVGSPSGKFASYLIELRCEKATANVKINLQKTKDKWAVIGFWVDIQEAGVRSSPMAPAQ
jgi:hypothetical protein